jgi:hypothetical protein
MKKVADKKRVSINVNAMPDGGGFFWRFRPLPPTLQRCDRCRQLLL